MNRMLQSFPFLHLHDWYLSQGRHDLPWRDYNYDKKTLGYRIWLAETMLQQTQAQRVSIYFENILQAFPSVEDLAACSYEDFFPYYKGLGYYSRARNMLAAAHSVAGDFGGVFPDTTEKLRSLKGVGPYTAEAIRAFAYEISTLSFDTNLEKIFSRYYHGNKFQKLSKDEKAQILADFQSSEISARDINNALMDYGATISLNNISGIDWDNYPLLESKFYQTRGQLEPVKEKKKSSFPNKQAYVIAILHENHKVYFGDTCESGGQTPRSTPTELCRGEPRCSPDVFTPFFIGKNTGNPRAMTQEFFLQHHGLEVSVRPPEVKSYNQNEVPYMVCYCQIQSGKHHFSEFPGLKVRGFEEGYIERMEIT